jgi:hypothetical protein
MPEFAFSDARRALLYAGGELDGIDAAEFEKRLGEEQSLREALCQAVELVRKLEGLPLLVPRPDYRERVRQRLQPRARFGSWLTHERTYRGHPVLWAGLGAIAGLLVVFAAVPHPSLPAQPQPPARWVAEPTPPTVPEPPAEAPVDPATIEMAETFASLPSSDHLARAHDEENRRRERRLLHGDHLLHPLGKHGVRH